MADNERRTWPKYAAISALIVLFLSVYPQLNLWMAKGSAWQGAYFASNYDEVAYSAYVNALIDGRPRENDPFTGTDAARGESLYSIQFIPAYLIALPARALGLDPSSVFIVLNFLIAILSALAIFFLIRAVTGDDMFAAVGVVVVLCLGTAAANQGVLRHWITGNVVVDFFPFLRRYQPGVAFPFFFIFCLTVWRMLTSAGKRLAYAVAAGTLFVVLVFSYFYLWTAALAWLGCISVLWFIGRKTERKRLLTSLAIIGIFAIVALGFYFWLLAGRDPNTDAAQLLSHTRMPDLFVVPEIIGLTIIAATIYLIRKKKLAFGSPEVLMTLSLAATPIFLFNQQVITGRSLQPVHYEIFIANYLVLTATVLFFWLMTRAYDGSAGKIRRAFVYVGIAAVAWGFIESTATAAKYSPFERIRDDAMPALNYLDQRSADLQPGDVRPAVLATSLLIADFVPTATSFRPLWNPHANSAGGLSFQENKELFYRYLYFSGFDDKKLAKALDGDLFEFKGALFGGGRALAALDGTAKQISRGEMQEEVRLYKEFSDRFDRAQAASPLIRYAIVPAADEPDLSNLDRWYQRDGGRDFGPFRVYELTLKP